MRSLRVKFEALIIALLSVGCLGLAWIATQHERLALEVEVGKRASALVENLARNAKEPLLADDELTLSTQVTAIGKGAGIAGVRLLGREGIVLASLNEEEVGLPGETATLSHPEDNAGTVLRRDHLLLASIPIFYSGVRMGEAQVELDLALLVSPVVRESARQMAIVAVVVIALGVGAGLAFVTFLVEPLRRLRAGVERLSAGDLSARVAPTSQDEVGELAHAFNKMGESLQQKERIQSAFGRYVSDYVLKQLLKNPDGEALEGAERDVSVFFADVRNFTRLSEGMEARKVVALLNEVFHIASECILARGGTIDKFMGDSVMAYFGAPAPQSDHPTQAVYAALDLQRALAERNQKIENTGEGERITAELGIGIHTGSVVVGNIGSPRRTDYTAVGDAVNVAHRIEKLAEPGQVLVSEAVQRRVLGVFRLRFEGERQLSGRQEPVHVYSVEPGSELRGEYADAEETSP